MPTADLTTTRAPFIETARTRGEMFIRQPYDLYSPANHTAWRLLYERLEARWEKCAAPAFLVGLDRLELGAYSVPRLDQVNRRLERFGGFTARPVSGYVPAHLFFDCLRRREFPTTVTIRSQSSLDYLPEPDIFHDVAGHVPMHTDREFAAALVEIGEVAQRAAERARTFDSVTERLGVLESNVRALARFFWFTVEFGLMDTGNGVCAYGSGLLSSFAELEHAVSSPAVARHPLQLEWVIHQSFEIDRFQPLLFVIDSADQLFAEVKRLAVWLEEGRLDDVAPGQPAADPADLESFLAVRTA